MTSAAALSMAGWVAQGALDMVDAAGEATSRMANAGKQKV